MLIIQQQFLFLRDSSLRDFIKGFFKEFFFKGFFIRDYFKGFYSGASGSIIRDFFAFEVKGFSENPELRDFFPRMSTGFL